MNSIKSEILTHARKNGQESNKKLLNQVYRHHKRTGEGIGSIFAKLASTGFKWLPSLFRGATSAAKGAASAAKSIGSAALSGLKRVGTTAKSISSKITPKSNKSTPKPYGHSYNVNTETVKPNNALHDKLVAEATKKSRPTAAQLIGKKNNLKPAFLNKDLEKGVLSDKRQLFKKPSFPETPKQKLPRKEQYITPTPSKYSGTESDAREEMRRMLQATFAKKGEGIMCSSRANKQREGILKHANNIDLKAKVITKTGGKKMTAGAAMKTVAKGGVIIKEGDKYKLLSHKGKDLGTFSNVAQAKNRERQIQYFKNAKTAKT